MSGIPVLHDASVALVVAGTVVIVASCLGALAARGSYHRLHFSTPITSLGGPLLAIGLAVHDKLGLITASILFPTGLLALISPSMSSAVARMLAQLEGRLGDEGPD